MRRLADVCEAHFAARLESQLSLWPSLAPAQQCALVDALLDWARYSDTLGRKALRGFCVHCVARHLDIARGRWAAGGTACRNIFCLFDFA